MKKPIFSSLGLKNSKEPHYFDIGRLDGHLENNRKGTKKC
jgi:hypothetical protein